MGTEEWAKENGLTPLARFVDAETAAVDYIVKQEGLLLAPVYAVPRMLARNGLTLQDFDFYEIHEAFAAQTLATLKAWRIRPSARTVWDSTSRSARSTVPSSTSRADRSRPPTRSPQPAGASSPTLRSCSKRRAPDAD